VSPTADHSEATNAIDTQPGVAEHHGVRERVAARIANDRRLMGTVFVVFIVLSAGALLVGGDRYRQTGLLGLSLFGVWGVLWFIGEFLTKPAAPARVGSVALPDGTPSRGLIIPGRVGKARTGLVALATCMVVSAFMAVGAYGPPEPRMPSPTTWALIALLSAAGVAASARGLRDRDRFLALTPKGLHVRTMNGDTLVPWSSISSVEQTARYGQPMLSIDVIDPAAIERKRTPSWYRSLERAMSGSHETIVLAGYALAPEAITSLVRRYLDNPGDRPSLATTAPAAA
jgi:hypothetical protein